MAATHRIGRKDRRRDFALAGLPDRPLAEGDQRSRLHPAELRALRRRRDVPRAGHDAHDGDLETADRALPRGAAEGRARRLPDPSSITAHAPGYIDRDNEIIVGLQTDAPLKRAIMPNGGFRMVANALKTYGYEPDPHVVEAFTQVPQDPQRRGLRRLHGRRAALPQLAHPHGPARRLRPRPDHRRLPPRRALRRRPADRAQAAGEGQPRRRAVDRRDHPRSRGAVRADPRAQGAAEDGGELRLRHLASGAHREGGRAVALLRLPRRREGTERRRHVARPHVDVPRHLLRARSRRRERSPRSRRRRSSTTSSSSCASSASCARPSTTSSSPAIRPGSPSRSAAWATTAGRS